MAEPRDPALMHHYTYDRDMAGYCSQCMLPDKNWRHYAIGVPIQESRKPSPALPFTPRLV